MLDIKGLYKSFPLQPEPVLNNINLTLEKGEFCILLGSNGSGKTSLLKAIFGEYKADSGAIYLDNQDISKLPIYERAGMVSSVVQDVSNGTVDNMTLLENLVISYLRGKNTSLGIYKRHSMLMYKLVAELGFGLEKYLNMPIGSLSGGQRQIISTLMATMSNTKLLLLDEHTSALDPKARVALMRFTAEKIDSKNITTLMVTHNFSDAIEYGDRVLILHHGNIVFDISGQAKMTLTKDHLLRLFHSLEDGIY